MTDIDYLISRFHELFRRQDVQRRLNRMTYEQTDREQDPSEEGEQPQ